MKPAAPELMLVSHVLCPYVQRAAIVLAEKGAAFERRDVVLANKPDWFLAISPLGKTPVLLVDGTPLFESAVICEYLDETIAPRFLPSDALERARERAWIAFASATLDTIAGLYNAPSEAALKARQAELSAKFAQVEAILGAGPFFAGERFGLVDAAFAPVFRYFDVLDEVSGFATFESTPKLREWRATSTVRRSVRDAVAPDYAARLLAFLLARGSALSARIEAITRRAPAAIH